jgi:signal recognition particle subunit SRP54
MFNRLQNRFSKIFSDIKGHGKISEKNISKAIREIRIALLESDVNFKVVSAFINRVKEKALGAKVFDSVTPGQQFIKIVQDELVIFLSSDDININLNKTGITVIVMAGLQGSGKTTTSVKIASFLKREYSKNPLLVGADLQRLAAKDQLKILGDQNNIDVYISDNKKDNPINVAINSLSYAKNNNNDAVIIDTAGRLHIDDLLMEELGMIINAVNPHEILYVIDGMTGQDAIKSTEIFAEKNDLTGVIITKMDGDSGGGVALSVKEITNCPIKFMTSGESISNIEIFNPVRIAKRILGLTDIVGLVEKAQEAFDEASAKELEQKIKNNEFDLNDFSNQMKQFNKLGSISEFSKFIPGIKNIGKVDLDEKQFKWINAIIDSMTNKEKKNPSIINGSRRLRIAKGSGRSVNEVNRLIKQFNQIKLLMKKSKKMNLGKFPFKI